MRGGDSLSRVYAIVGFVGGIGGPVRSGSPGELDEDLLGGAAGLAGARLAARVGAVGLHVPGRAVVLLVDAQDRLELGPDGAGP